MNLAEISRELHLLHVCDDVPPPEQRRRVLESLKRITGNDPNVLELAKSNARLEDCSGEIGTSLQTAYAKAADQAYRVAVDALADATRRAASRRRRAYAVANRLSSMLAEFITCDLRVEPVGLDPLEIIPDCIVEERVSITVLGAD